MDLKVHPNRPEKSEFALSYLWPYVISSDHVFDTFLRRIRVKQYEKGIRPYFYRTFFYNAVVDAVSSTKSQRMAGHSARHDHLSIRGNVSKPV